MTTFAELVELVNSFTARPDLVSETRTGITGAIRKFHLADTFQADLRVLDIDLGNYPTGNATWSLDTKSILFERFRKLYHVYSRPGTNVATLHNGMPSMPPEFCGVPPEIDIVSPADLVDRNGLARANYAYIAGNSLVIKLTSVSRVLQLHYFTHPEIVTAGNTATINSWIADDMPEAVATEAAATVLRMIGKDEEGQRMGNLFGENLALLRQSAVMAN